MAVEMERWLSNQMKLDEGAGLEEKIKAVLRDPIFSASSGPSLQKDERGFYWLMPDGQIKGFFMTDIAAIKWREFWLKGVSDG